MAVERTLFELGAPMVVGMDEAGRGALAGPVVVAAFGMSPYDLPIEAYDSKSLSRQRREALARQIRSRRKTWAIGSASVREIETEGIAGAIRVAAGRALRRLASKLGGLSSGTYVLVDGPVPFLERTGLGDLGVDIGVVPIVDGDASCVTIAAASVLAKVYRDRVMARLDSRFPQFGFGRHMGYGTADHTEALRRYGPTGVHRRNFSPVAAACSEHPYIASFTES